MQCKYTCIFFKKKNLSKNFKELKRFTNYSRKMTENNINVERFNDLIKKIKGIKRITQGKISILAGYSTENYLAEAKSTGNITDNIIESLEILYDRAKKNPEILNTDSIHLEKTDKQIIEDRGDRLFALEVAMKALIGIVLDQQQEIFKKSFSEVSDFWDERIGQAHKLLMEKLKNE